MDKFILFLFLIGTFMYCNSASENVLWIDVRTKSEFNIQHVAGSKNIPFDKIENSLHLLPKDKTSHINVYCRSGRRSNMAKNSLSKLGFLNVTEDISIKQ